jgi:hypothetical protein
MIRKIAVFITCISIIQFSFAQGTSYPKGGYRDFSELKNKNPSIPYTFNIEKRKISEIKLNGGADYRITSSDKTIFKKFIKKNIFAISTGDTLYINCYLQFAQKRYAKVISEGKYLIYYAPINNGKAARISSQRGSSGAIGGAIEGAEIAVMRNLYALDTSSFGIARPLNSARLLNILEQYPYLLQRYQSELNKNDEDIMLRYIIMVNQE